jgi:heat shock protein HslJ
MNAKQRSIVALLTAGIFLAACGGMGVNPEPDQNEVNGAAENDEENVSLNTEDTGAPSVQSPVEEPSVSAESLAAETWVLTSYGSPDQPQAILEGVVISLEYQPIQGRLGGTAGCNSYFGGVTIDEDQQLFSIGTIGMTRKACAEPTMEQESAFIRMLEKVTRFAILDGTLFLYTGSGEVLTFVPGEVPSGRQ